MCELVLAQFFLLLDGALALGALVGQGVSPLRPSLAQA